MRVYNVNSSLGPGARITAGGIDNINQQFCRPKFKVLGLTHAMAHFEGTRMGTYHKCQLFVTGLLYD